MKEALSARGGSNSITTVKTDLVWPTLTDDKSDTKAVVLFYEEFEDVCALANNCRLRVDLLTSCAKVLREATGFKPQFLLEGSWCLLSGSEGWSV